jgi:hypothetical protein
MIQMLALMVSLPEQPKRPKVSSKPELLEGFYPKGLSIEKSDLCWRIDMLGLRV